MCVVSEWGVVVKMSERLALGETYFFLKTKFCDKNCCKKQSSHQIFMEVLQNESNQYKLKNGKFVADIEKVCPNP